MKKRVKLFTTIASLCLAVALMAFGVYAAANVTYNVNGTVSYVMTDVLVNVTTKLQASTHMANAAGHTKVEDFATYQWQTTNVDINGDAEGTDRSFTTINANGTADDSVFEENYVEGTDTGTITHDGLAYDFTLTSIYKLTVNVKVSNYAGVDVTPTFVAPDADANYYVVASHTAKTTVAKATTAGQDFVFYIAIKDVTKQIPSTALDFVFTMAQTPAQQG